MPMPQNEARVSVIMGVRYRREDTALLERAIKSILTQTWGELELLICQCDSTERAREVMKGFAWQDDRVRLLESRVPGTLAQNLNDCLKMAKGTYIARMDDDDCSHPERLAKQLAFLDSHRELSFVGCNAALYRNGVPVGRRMLPERPTVRDFQMTQPFLHPALLFRREVLEAVGGYYEDRHCVLCEDYDLLLRLYSKGLVGANLQEVLLDYTLPTTAKGGRTMAHRWNETVTRWRRFRELHLLPGALLWIVKPLAVGMVPGPMLDKVKKHREGTQDG